MTNSLIHPEHIKVGTVEYAINSDPDDWIKLEHETQTKGNYGYTKNLNATIYLNPEADQRVVALTLFHELLHALCESVMGAPDWRHLGKTKVDREEQVVRMLEGPLLSVLTDNPDLFRFLVTPTAAEHSCRPAG